MAASEFCCRGYSRWAAEPAADARRYWSHRGQRPRQRTRRWRVRSARAAACAAGDAPRRFFGSPAGRSNRLVRKDRRHLQRDRHRQRAHGAPARRGRPCRRPRRPHPAPGAVRAVGRRLGRHGDFGQHADRRSLMADRGGHSRDRGGGPGRPVAHGAARCRRAGAEGRVPALGDDRQHHDQAIGGVHLRGDPRGPRGRHRRQARRSGAGPRSQRRVEGPDRERQLDGLEPDRPGAQHRRGHDRGRQRRSIEKDHGRRARRDPAAQGGHQHDGRPAALVRLGSDPGRPRGRHRGQARRPGPGSGCRRHLEGFDRLGQCDVRQPDRPGAQHRQCDDRGRPRRSFAQDHGRCARRNPRAQGHHQHDGRPAQRVCLRGDARRPRGRHRRPARRPGAGAGRRRHLEGSDRLGQLHGRQFDRPGAQHRRSLDRDCPRRSVEKDHGQRLRRDPAAEGDHQHDGRPAQRLCRRGHARGARGRHRRAARRPGQRARRRRHLEGSDRERQLDGRQFDRAGAQHRRGRDRDRQRRSVEKDHGQRLGRDPAAEGHHQHDGRSAERLCRRGDARRARGRHRGQARRSGPGPRRCRHLEGSDGQRQLHGRQPDRPGAQHRRGRHRRRPRRSVEKNHGHGLGRDPAAEGDHQHDGRPAQRLCRRGHAGGARGRHRRPARRPGGGARRRRHLEGPDRQRQLDGRQSDRPGAQHRRGRDRDRQWRSVAQDHRRRARRDPSAEGNPQHDGRSAQPLCRRGDARRPRGRHRGPARRPGAGAGRRRHLEGSDRQRQLDGREPDRPGAQHRRGDDRGRPRRSLAQDHGRRQRRDPRAQEHDQHDGRPAERLCLRGDARRARGRHRGQARRPGRGAGRGRHLEGPDRQRQFHGLEPDRPGAQHRRGRHRDRQWRSVEKDHGRRARRDPAAQGDPQHDGRAAALVCRRGDARRPRGRHRRASSAARRWCRVWPAPGRI